VAGCTNPFRLDNRIGPRVLSVRESRFKLMLQFDGDARNPMVETLYDLDADPREQAPLAPATQKPVRRRLLETAREHLRRSREQRDLRTRLQARLHELRLEWKKPAEQASPVAS
jgi:hypothetical protein